MFQKKYAVSNRDEHEETQNIKNFIFATRDESHHN